jgi:hypothetical protein
MLFHLPSFALGYASGIATAVITPRLKPIGMELATAAFRLWDAMAVGAARRREDLQDLVAEARARARNAYTAARPS